MPLAQCPTCNRFFKSPADHQDQGHYDECPGCKATSGLSPRVTSVAPGDEPATPNGCRSLVLFGIAALSGPMICRAVSPPMWVVVPMAIVSAVLGIVEPRRPWRWGLAIVGSPLLILLATEPFVRDIEGQEVMHFWPLEAAFLIAFGGACAIAAYFGSLLRHHLTGAPTGPSPE